MDFRQILKVLSAAEVEFVVIGGVAAVLHGVMTSTFDLDIVHSRSEENRRRIAAALEELNACYRQHLPKRLEPRADDFGGPGHHLLMTDGGPLDLLGQIVGGRGYEQLSKRSSSIEVHGHRVQVLDLEVLIRLKEEMGREKDLAHLPLLRQALEQRRRRP